MIMTIINKTFLVFLIIALKGNLVIGQNSADKAIILNETNVEALANIAAKARLSYSNNLSRRTDVPKQITNSKNKVGYLAGFDTRGKPIYDYDDNIDVARTLRVNRIWIGGSKGLDLDGSGVRIGHWEAGGLALSSHQDLTGRVEKGESAPVTSHATHTAGTMIGKGVIFGVQGMANAAEIISYRSNNDEAEMAEFAIAGGILSNHSYSSNDPDGNIQFYGQYTENSGEWDEIMYYAPYLLSCKSAGNNRNDGVNVDDGGYDLVYTIAVAKNILTVGAINDVPIYDGPSSVQQSEFSAWGPTDDWRIKPDLVSSGVSVQSADNGNNSSYSSKNGTSMAVAAVTGSVALLQQHYHTLNEVYMKSATVKALLICTTDEAGNSIGPDFQNGWGLLNAESAAEVISQNGGASIIEEYTLLNEETYSKEVYIDGSLPVSLAIAWTDPPGESIGGHDNQTPILVNDLDVRISGNNAVFEPWTMSPNSTSDNFEAEATQGDNFRDNVEKIDLGIIPEGIYTINVTHKGMLQDGKQAFSLVVRGLQENVLSVTPEGDQSISIYPMPSKNGIFNIAFSNDSQEERYSIQLFDAQGRLIESKNQTKKQAILDYSSLNPGHYYIKIETKNAVSSRILVIGK